MDIPNIAFHHLYDLLTQKIFVKELTEEQLKKYTKVDQAFWNIREVGKDGTNFFEKIFGKTILRTYLFRKYTENKIEKVHEISIKPRTFVLMVTYLKLKDFEMMPTFHGELATKAKKLRDEFLIEYSSKIREISDLVYNPIENQLSINSLTDNQNEEFELRKGKTAFANYRDIDAGNIQELIINFLLRIKFEYDQINQYFLPRLVDNKQALINDLDELFRNVVFIDEIHVWDYTIILNDKKIFTSKCKVFFVTTEENKIFSEKKKTVITQMVAKAYNIYEFICEFYEEKWLIKSIKILSHQIE